jgi:hypothetical protein
MPKDVGGPDLDSSVSFNPQQIAKRRPAAVETERVGGGELDGGDRTGARGPADEAGPEAQVGIMREDIAVMRDAAFATREQR